MMIPLSPEESQVVKRFPVWVSMDKFELATECYKGSRVLSVYSAPRPALLLAGTGFELIQKACMTVCGRNYSVLSSTGASIKSHDITPLVDEIGVILDGDERIAFEALNHATVGGRAKYGTRAHVDGTVFWRLIDQVWSKHADCYAHALDREGGKYHREPKFDKEEDRRYTRMTSTTASCNVLLAYCYNGDKPVSPLIACQNALARLDVVFDAIQCEHVGLGRNFLTDITDLRCEARRELEGEIASMAAREAAKSELRSI